METFTKHGVVLRTSQAISAGIHPETLYKLRDEGVIHNLSRGLYCLSSSEILYSPDLVAAALRVPDGVACLISALAFSDITTQVPHSISFAIPRGARQPVIDYPPMEFYSFNEKSYTMGRERHDIAGVSARSEKGRHRLIF